MSKKERNKLESWVSSGLTGRTKTDELKTDEVDGAGFCFLRELDVWALVAGPQWYVMCWIVVLYNGCIGYRSFGYRPIAALAYSSYGL
jgi:hypothetical protein